MDENLVTPKKGNIVWIYSVSWYVQNGFEITLFDLYPVTMISMVNIAKYSWWFLCGDDRREELN